MSYFNTVIVKGKGESEGRVVLMVLERDIAQREVVLESVATTVRARRVDGLHAHVGVGGREVEGGEALKVGVGNDLEAMVANHAAGKAVRKGPARHVATLLRHPHQRPCNVQRHIGLHQCQPGVQSSVGVPQTHI